MKLKCIDGKVREFGLPFTNNIGKDIEACCCECGEEFGIHDTKILKPIFKNHVCKKECVKVLHPGCERDSEEYRVIANTGGTIINMED